MPTQTLNNFCGINISESTSFIKYIYDDVSKVVTPCGESLFILLDHYFFAFIVTLSFFHVVCFFY